jgi:phospholipid/cholesterol/gamma-HCH transport system ATP-binding protein
MSTTQEVALDVKDIYKSFGDKLVHQGVSFQLFKGEILGLFGGSGTGKSVILRSIIGLENPDGGSIVFQNSDLTQLSEKALYPIRKKISYVFQNGALFDSLNVEENLAYPLREHTKLSESEILTKVNHMLELVDLVGANKLLPIELSGGMQKRAGLARAIIMEPEIILFDEPTAGLDPSNTRRLIQNILKLKTKGITGIFVTHDIPSAFEISDRIALLWNGKIYCVDTPAGIQSSKDPLIQAFLAGSMNAEQ